MQLFDIAKYSACPSTEDTDQRYTPLPILEKCDRVLGGIGLDPTANPQKTVPALHHITEAQNCFLTNWAPLLKDLPTVFMNPPYSNSAPFLDQMAKYIRSGDIDRAITLTLAGVVFNKSTQPLVKELAVAIAFPLGRINFIGGGNSNDRDVCFILWGNGADESRFTCEFCDGLVVKPGVKA